MNILVTGSNGFIGRNLSIHLKEAGFENVENITRDDDDIIIEEKVKNADLWKKRAW